jgi:F-type H+-transporting ATPase subunit b
MKRALRLALILCLTAAFTFAEEKSGGEGEGNLQFWKWANFLVLAGALGYLAVKNGGPFFKARSEQIRKDIVESGKIREDAEARAAAVDRRLAALETEIAALRTESHDEARAERQRFEQHTAAEMAKIQEHAQQEIEAAGKAARMELKRYTAELAVQLAEQKIRSRMTPDTQAVLVRTFVSDMGDSSSRAQST